MAIELKFDLTTFAAFTEFPQPYNDKGEPQKSWKFKIAELEQFGLHYELCTFLLLAHSLDEGISFWENATLPDWLDTDKVLVNLAYKEGMPSGLYGPILCQNKGQLVLSMGSFEFPVVTQGKDLIIGGLTGNFETESNQDGTKKFLKVRFVDTAYRTEYQFIIPTRVKNWESPPSIGELNAKLVKGESIAELFDNLTPPVTLMDELDNGDYKVVKILEPKEGTYGLNVMIICEEISTYLQKGHPSHMRATKGFDLATKSGDYQVINKQIEDGKEWILRIVDGGVKKAGINKGQPKKNSQLFPSEFSFPTPKKAEPLMLSASVEEIIDAQASLFPPEPVTVATTSKKPKTKTLDEIPF